DGYISAVRAGATPWERYFRYSRHDLQVFYLTRRLAALAIDRDDYQQLFESDPAIDYGGELRALEAEGLIEATPAALRPTPRGMFYADSIAALLAWRQTRRLRANSPVRSADDPDEVNSNGRNHM